MRKHGGGVNGAAPATPPPSNLRWMVPLPTSCARREEPDPFRHIAALPRDKLFSTAFTSRIKSRVTIGVRG